jgi:hypothetical protein
MFPWIWFWCPTYNYPRSGAVAQNIDPNTNWFFHAFGLVTEVVLHLADEPSIDPASANESLRRLKTLHQQIDAQKTDALIAQLRRLKSDRPDDFERVRAEAMALTPTHSPA